jgi:hypothetical protein
MTADQARRRTGRTRLPTSIKGAAALQDLIKELALVLLPRGMTPKRFGELARSAFVHAAADLSRLRNGKVNHSRVAAQTGLSRADVKRLLKPNGFEANFRGQSALERVINGWRTDSAFATRAANPKRLVVGGTRASFTHLVRKYGGDIPHRAVLAELIRIGAVRESDGYVVLQRSEHVRRRYDFAFLAPVLPALLDGLRIASATPRSEASSSVHRLAIPAETELDLSIIRDRCTSSAQSMLEGLADSLGKQVTVPRTGRRTPYSFAVTILLAENKPARIQRSRSKPLRIEIQRRSV